MKLTHREKLLLPFLPLAILLIAYAWWFNVAQRPKVRQIEEAYRQAVAHEVRPHDLLRRQLEVEALQRDVANLKRQKDELDRKAAEMTGMQAAFDRHARNQALNDLLSRHRLQLLEEAPAASGAAGKLPKSLADALSKLLPSASAKPAAHPLPLADVQIRSMRFTGRFADVFSAIQELSQGKNPPGVPIALSMDEADLHVDKRAWTLLVWM